MKTKLTFAAGLIATTIFLAAPASSEAGSCGSRSGLSISFSSGPSYHHGSSYFRYSSPRYYHKTRSYYRPKTYHRSVTYYQPATRYVTAPAQRVSVADVQYVLKSRGYHVGRVDGVMGSKTRLAIKRFQRDVGLHACGTLTPATLRAMGL